MSESNYSRDSHDPFPTTGQDWQNLLLKVLKSSESILPASTVDALKLKIKEVTKHPESAVACVEDFLYTLLGRVEVLNHSAQLKDQKADYTVLQEILQRAEGDIRKHISIEQQLMLDADQLEEKIEVLKRKLLIEEQKYEQLFESMKSIDRQRKDLLKSNTNHQSLLQYQTLDKEIVNLRKMSNGSRQLDKGAIGFQKRKRIPSDRIRIEDPAKRTIEGSFSQTKRPKDKFKPKGKSIIEKIHERSKKLLEQKRDMPRNGGVIRNESYERERNNQMPKKFSYDKDRVRYMQYQSNFRQITKTIQMKAEKPVRRVYKYAAEVNDVRNNSRTSESAMKAERCSSVCI